MRSRSLVLCFPQKCHHAYFCMAFTNSPPLSPSKRQISLSLSSLSVFCLLACFCLFVFVFEEDHICRNSICQRGTCRKPWYATKLHSSVSISPGFYIAAASTRGSPTPFPVTILGIIFFSRFEENLWSATCEKTYSEAENGGGTVNTIVFGKCVAYQDHVVREDSEIWYLCTCNTAPCLAVFCAVILQAPHPARWQSCGTGQKP